MGPSLPPVRGVLLRTIQAPIRFLRITRTVPSACLSMSVIGDRLGYGLKATTSNSYGHLLQAANRQVADTMGRLLRYSHVERAVASWGIVSA